MKIYTKTILTAVFVSILNYSCESLCGDEDDKNYQKKPAKIDTLSAKRS